MTVGNFSFGKPPSRLPGKGIDWFTNKTPLWSSKGCSSPSQVLPCSDTVVLQQQVESFVRGGLFYSGGEAQISTCNSPRYVLVGQISSGDRDHNYMFFLHDSGKRKIGAFFYSSVGFFPLSYYYYLLVKNFHKSQFSAVMLVYQNLRCNQKVLLSGPYK